MKAWRVDDGDEWCVLVFAPTRSRAKSLFKKKGPSTYNHDYSWVDIHATRHPELDNMIDHEKLYDSPEELPEGVVFWNVMDDEEFV